MIMRFAWARIINGKRSTFGTLVVLMCANGRPYLQLQVDDDHYDGVIDADDVAELQATLGTLQSRARGVRYDLDGRELEAEQHHSICSYDTRRGCNCGADPSTRLPKRS